MTLTIPLPSPGVRRDDLFTPIAELLPLPQETYPRIFDKRKPDKGYYIAVCLVLSLWVITPFSCVYLLWFAIFGPGISGRAGLTSTIFAAYALTEVVFAIYHYYLIHFVQAPAPPSELPLEIRNALFQKVLHAGLAYPEVPTRSLDQAYGEDGYFEHAERLYGAGLMSAKQLHHARDHEYEDAMGIGRPRRRVGRISQEDKNVIESFVEENEGDRERRLRQQIEGDTMGLENEEAETRLEDAYGNRVMLHAHDRRAVEFRERLRTWFNHAPWESLRRQNVLAWLSWSCFTLPYEEAKKNRSFMIYLEKTMKTLEARTGMIIPEGYDPEISILRLTLDPVNAKSRPLLLYALSNGINAWLRNVVYPHQGMKLYTEGEIDYLIRIPPGWTPERNDTRSNSVPLVYLQGLGFGLLQNHLLIKHLIKSLPTHPLLIPIPPHTSQSVFHPRHLRPWSRPEVVSVMKRICTKWGFWEEGDDQTPSKGGVSMLSHSNGSVAHGWLLKDSPSLVKRSTFVDPVVFCLWEGDVCHSFCYRQPATALELLLYYFIASEVGIANYIQRHFDWADNTLFFEEIPNGLDPRKTAFFLGGKDIIIDAARTRKYLEGHGVTPRGLHWDAKAGHGDGLSGDSRNRVVMYAGTGSTRGWKGWIKSGRHRHSMGMKDWQEQQAASGHGMGIEIEGVEGPITGSSQSSFTIGSLLDSSEPTSPIDVSDEDGDEWAQDDDE